MFGESLCLKLSSLDQKKEKQSELQKKLQEFWAAAFPAAVFQRDQLWTRLLWQRNQADGFR